MISKSILGSLNDFGCKVQSMCNVHISQKWYIFLSLLMIKNIVSMSNEHVFYFPVYGFSRQKGLIFLSQVVLINVFRIYAWWATLLASRVYAVPFKIRFCSNLSFSSLAPLGLDMVLLPSGWSVWLPDANSDELGLFCEWPRWWRAPRESLVYM